LTLVQIQQHNPCRSVQVVGPVLTDLAGPSSSRCTCFVSGVPDQSTVLPWFWCASTPCVRRRRPPTPGPAAAECPWARSHPWPPTIRRCSEQQWPPRIRGSGSRRGGFFAKRVAGRYAPRSYVLICPITEGASCPGALNAVDRRASQPTTSLSGVFYAVGASKEQW
jgi:hypothetical protein